MDLLAVTPEQVEKAFKRMGYKLDVAVHLWNVFGIRANTGFTNKFDDIIGGYALDDAAESYALAWKGTTDPGLYWLEHPMNVNGTAILKEGQYIDSHKIGKHKGAYPALVQNKPLPVWRDRDMDKEYDHEVDETGMIGLNIHRANEAHESVEVGQWSAACQVIASPTDYAKHWEKIDLSAKYWGDVFTYTLFTEEQFFGVQPTSVS